MLNAGLSLTSLMKILGHKTLVMTLVYAKITDEKVHIDHSQGIKKLNDVQIPLFIAEKTPPSVKNAFFFSILLLM